MKMLKFQIAAAETVNWAIGGSVYAPGQEFPLSEAQVAKWISKADVEGGHVLCLGEWQGSDFSVATEVVHDYLDGKLYGSGGLRSYASSPGQNLRLVSYEEYVTLAASDTNGVGQWLPKIDGELVSIEVAKDLVQLGANNYKFDVTKFAYGVGIGTSILTNLGTSAIPASQVSLQVAAGTITDYTTAAGDASDATHVTLPDAHLSADHLYLGWTKPFDGLYFDLVGASVNTAASPSLLVEYPKLNDDGTTTWTTLSQVADTTVNTGATLANDGSITWLRPANWAKAALIPGSTTAYHIVRLSNPSATLDLTDGSAGPVLAENIYVISRTLSMSSVPVKAGDVFRIDTKAASSADATLIRFWVRETH
jgi:hypothetical protein